MTIITGIENIPPPSHDTFFNTQVTGLRHRNRDFGVVDLMSKTRKILAHFLGLLRDEMQMSRAKRASNDNQGELYRTCLIRT